MVVRTGAFWKWIGICGVATFTFSACATHQSNDAAPDIAGDRPAVEDAEPDRATADGADDTPVDAADARADLRDATADRTDAGADAPDAAGTDGASIDGGTGSCTIVHLPPIQTAVDAILADLDGDGQLDIVTAEHSGAVGFYRRDGRRSFAAPQTLATTTVLMANHYLEAVATGDLDGDGKLDIVITNNYGLVGLLLTGAGGGFTAQDLSPDQSGVVWHIAVADFDGDGHPDIAQAVYDRNSVRIWWGKGGGAFLPVVSTPACTYPMHLRVIDANEDQRPDMVVGCYGGGSRVLINNGGRSFSAMGQFALGGVHSGTGDADLNGDGHVDLVFPDFGFKQVQVYLGDGTGQFSAPTGLLSKPPDYPDSTAMGDFDGDGLVDLVIGDPNAGQLSFYSGTGDGHFQSRKVLALPSSGNNVAAADIDGDGIDDVVSDDWDKGIDVLFGPCP